MIATQKRWQGRYEPPFFKYRIHPDVHRNIWYWKQKWGISTSDINQRGDWVKTVGRGRLLRGNLDRRLWDLRRSSDAQGV